MATKAQTKANRQNAAKSTGPRTAKGKAAVSQNAVKHGFFAQKATIHGEKQSDFDLYREAFIAEWQPVGITESMLAERIASLSWRLRRAEQMENQAIEHLVIRSAGDVPNSFIILQIPMEARKEMVKSGTLGTDLSLGQAVVTDFTNYRVLDRLIMYERRIESSMCKMINKLKQLQVMRKIEKEGAEEQMAAEAAAPINAKAILKKQNQPPAFGGKSETRNTKSEIIRGCFEKTKPILKKAKCVSTYAHEEYKDKPRRGPRENKANQTQFQTCGRPSPHATGEIAPALPASQ